MSNVDQNFDSAEETRYQQKNGPDPMIEKRNLDDFNGRYEDLRQLLESDIMNAKTIRHAALPDIDTYHRTDKDFDRGQHLAQTTLTGMFTMLWAESQGLQAPKVKDKFRQIHGGWRFDLSNLHWMEVILGNQED